MFDNLKNYVRYTLAYLGDAAHRRFVATVIALAATYLLGKALDANDVAMVLEILIGGLAGGWSPTTPNVEDTL